MGSRKLLIFLFFFSIIPFCNAKGNITITESRITERGISISIILSDCMLSSISNIELFDEGVFNGILIENNNLNIEYTDIGINLNVDLYGIKLYMNKRYKLLIRFPGGWISANVFIGNPVSKINEYYEFPLIVTPNIKIVILEQNYLLGNARMSVTFLEPCLR
jgi:hypothetical protein